MQEQEIARETHKWFWTFAALHLTVWTAVPVLTQRNAPLDTVEMLFWGHEWQWGYYKHPPLPPWAAETMATLFGETVWPVYLLSQICVLGCLWAAWRMGREVLTPWAALAGAAVIELSLYYSITTPEFKHGVMANAFWALFALFLYWGIVRGRSGYWIAAGGALGMGFLARYDIVLLAVSLLVFSFANSRARSGWRTAGPYLMIGTSLLIISPHLWWMVETDFMTIDYIFKRSATEPSWLNHFVHPLHFLGMQLLYLGVLLLMVVMAMEFRFRVRRVDDTARFHRAYLAWVVLGPLAIAVLFSLLTGARLGSRWGTSMFVFTGVLLFSLWEVQRGNLVYRRVVYMSGLIGLTFAIGLGVRNQFGSELRGEPLRVDFPGQRLSQEVDRLWRQHSDAPLKLVGGDWWLAGNVNVYHPERPSVYIALDESLSPWASDRTLMSQGGVVIWDASSYSQEQIERLQQRFPTAKVLDPIELEWEKTPQVEPLRVFVAVVRAADEHVAARRQNSLR